MVLAAFCRSRVMAFPVPREYQRIRDDLYGFLEAARDKADVETTHRSYTMCQGVFQVYRRRLTLVQSIKFANILPAGIRALYVADWEVADDDVDLTSKPTPAPLPFTGRQEMTQEVKHLRPSHNFAPDSAIADVAFALHQYVDPIKWSRVMSDLPPEAREFWEVPKPDDDDDDDARD